MFTRLSLKNFTNMRVNILQHKTAISPLMLHIHVLGEASGLHQLAAQGAVCLARPRGGLFGGRLVGCGGGEWAVLFHLNLSLMRFKDQHHSNYKLVSVSDFMRMYVLHDCLLHYVLHVGILGPSAEGDIHRVSRDHELVIRSGGVRRVMLLLLE